MSLRLRLVASIGIAFTCTMLSATGLRAQAGVARYIVELRDPPVIAYLARHRSARRLQIYSAAATSYRSQILARQATVKRWIQALPRASVLAQLDTVYNGLVVSLPPEDVALLRQRPDVAAVMPSTNYHKLLDAAVPLVDVPQAWQDPKIDGESNAGAGVKIAIIDTGIDINHPMFQDPSLAAPAGFPRFSTQQCNNPAQSDQQFTNSKVIVARNYVSLLDAPDDNCDAEDRDGHGTFVAATAAGLRVTAPLASISGVAPKAFLGSYKIFGTPGENDVAPKGAILKAIDDATKDGMDVINLSLGAITTGVPANDPLDVAVTNAVNAGRTVVVAAGNQGPAIGTLTSPGNAPAVITVGTSTNSRIVADPLWITANVPVPPSVQEIGAVPGNQFTADVPATPLVNVAGIDQTGTACSALPQGSLSGTMAFISRGNCPFSVKILNAFNAGAVAAVIYNNQTDQPPFAMDVGSSTQIPSAMIGNVQGLALAQLLSTPGGTVRASLQAHVAEVPVSPNRMASFSANGPSIDFGIKPDLVAPGTNIYSAAQRNFPAGVQYDPSGFITFSGTSFSTAMVTGAAALVRQADPNFTAAQIKSALVNTAAKVVTSPHGEFASVLSQGNGLLDAAAAINAPLTVAPVSISFGDAQNGALISSKSLSVTNASGSSDTFTVTVHATLGDAAVTVSPASLTLESGAGSAITAQVNLTTPPPSGSIEGYLVIQSQQTQTSVTVPYWGTFLAPAVNDGGVVDAAKFSAPSGVAPGELISIFGTYLANASGSASSVPLPQLLGGASVTIGGYLAPLLFASPTQINAQVPFEALGSPSVEIVVTLNGMASTPRTVPVSAAAPGIFTMDQTPTGPAAALHAVTSTLVTENDRALPGEWIELFTSGLGTVTPEVASGTAASGTLLSTVDQPPTVTVGGIPAPVSFAGLAPGFVGLYQVNVQIPNGAPPGNQPLTLTSQGANSNAATISIGQ